MIQIKDLTVRYHEDQRAIDRLSLNVGQGEFVLLTGPSGCGKSTLARCLNGLIPHASTATGSGRVVVDGMPTTDHRGYAHYRHSHQKGDPRPAAPDRRRGPSPPTCGTRPRVRRFASSTSGVALAVCPVRPSFPSYPYSTGTSATVGFEKSMLPMRARTVTG